MLSARLAVLLPLFVLAPTTFAQNPKGDEASVDAGLAGAQALQRRFAAIAKATSTSVVTVAAYVRDPAAEPAKKDGSRQAWVNSALDDGYPGFKRIGVGSGVFVSKDGEILTGRHILLTPEGKLADLIDVKTADSRHTICSFVGAEPTLNLAIIKLQVYAKGRMPRFVPVKFGNSAALEPGHWTFAIGDPVGPERVFTAGVLSAQPHRDCYQEQLTATYLQSSMTIHPEAYGGALVNLKGEFVGLLAPRHARSGTRDLGPRYGIEFALPSNIVVGLYKAIRQKRSMKSPWVGWSVMSRSELRRELGPKPFNAMEKPSTGIFIESTFDPSPAHVRGVRRGDFLLSFNGVRIHTPVEFQRELYLAGIGAEIEVELWQKGEKKKLKLKIEERPKNAITR